MPRLATNADAYTDGRLNVFFPGITRDLDGQCVSLVKGFLQDMTDVPNPQAARGDARYVGKNLVAQGHADEVPYADRQRGDIVCYEYGTYGHIGVVLSGNRTFEQNVNVGGAASRLIVDGKDSWYVYASRIGSLSEPWRHDMHIYRIKTYKEGNDMPRVPIPPEIVAQHYSNYTEGLVSLSPNDPACQNRFEDTTDDEFWYGLAIHIHNLLKSEMARLPDTHHARLMAVEYGLDFAGDDPVLIAAVGKTERAWRAELASRVVAKMNDLQKQVDAGGTGKKYKKVDVFVPEEDK